MFSKGTSKARTTQLAAPHTAPDSDHIRVVGYVRVSTDMQALEGMSLDAQSEKIKAYCKLDAMAHLKQQGVAMGGAPYGFAYSAVRDEAGRKRLVEVPEQMNMIARIVELCDGGTSASRIAALLNEEGTAAPQGDVWYTNIVRRILERNQRPGRRYKPRTKREPRVWDRQRATELALACRKDGLSLRAIAEQLDAANLAPPRGGEWYAAQVAELLGPMSAPNAVDERT